MVLFDFVLQIFVYIFSIYSCNGSPALDSRGIGRYGAGLRAYGRLNRPGRGAIPEPRRRGEPKRSNGLSPAAAQAVMRAATTDPLSDSQLEWVVRLALGKRVPAASVTGKAPVAQSATSGGDSSWALAPAAELIGDHQAERRLESEDGSESRASNPTRAGGSPPAVSRTMPASPGPLEVAAQTPSETSITQPAGACPPAEAAAAAHGGKK
jgi:hypothetical protein